MSYVKLGSSLALLINLVACSDAPSSIQIAPIKLAAHTWVSIPGIANRKIDNVFNLVCLEFTQTTAVDESTGALFLEGNNKITIKGKATLSGNRAPIYFDRFSTLSSAGQTLNCLTFSLNFGETQTLTGIYLWSDLNIAGIKVKLISSDKI